MSGTRPIVTRSPHRRVGFIACAWFQTTPIEYESLLERDFVRIALFDPTFSSINHQPFTLDLGDLGRYTPDYLLVGPDVRLVVEVKPEKFVNSSRNAPRLKRADEILRAKGYRFLVATEKLIRTDKKHHRAAVLLRHARSHIDSKRIVGILQIAATHSQGIEIEELASLAHVGVSEVLHLVGRRQLKLNPSLQFDASQKVYPVGGHDASL